MGIKPTMHKHKCQTKGKIIPAYIKEGQFTFYTNNISTITKLPITVPISIPINPASNE